MARRVLALALLLSILTSGRLQGGPASAAEESRITVVLCNMAGLPSRVLSEAKSRVDRILSNSRVDVDWVDACSGSQGQTYFTLVVLEKRPGDWRHSTDAMGRTVVPLGTYPRAYVYLDYVQQFNRTYGVKDQPPDHGVLLGHAMAHELGHLLEQPHSDRGIMAGKWGKEQRQEALQGTLLFSPPLPARPARTPAALNVRP